MLAGEVPVMTRTWLPALLCVAFLTGGLFASDKDPLDRVKDRRKAEAQRVESEFTDGRAAAYKLVRSDSPKLSEALDKLDALLDMLEKDNSLDAQRRKQLIVTIKWDMGEVKKIASERGRSSQVKSPPPSTVRRDSPPRREVEEERRDTVRDVKSTFDRRNDNLRDIRDKNRVAGENRNRIGRNWRSLPPRRLVTARSRRKGWSVSRSDRKGSR